MHWGECMFPKWFWQHSFIEYCFMWHGTRYVTHNVKSCFSVWNLSYESCMHREFLSSVCWEAFSMKWWVQLCGAGDTASSKVSFSEFGRCIPHKLLLFCSHFAGPPTADKPQARDREACAQYCLSSCSQQVVMGMLQAYSEHCSFLLWTEYILGEVPVIELVSGGISISVPISCLSAGPVGAVSGGSRGTEDPTWESSSYPSHSPASPVPQCTLSVISSSVAQGKGILLWWIYIVLNDPAGNFYL